MMANADVVGWQYVAAHNGNHLSVSAADLRFWTLELLSGLEDSGVLVVATYSKIRTLDAWQSQEHLAWVVRLTRSARARVHAAPLACGPWQPSSCSAGAKGEMVAAVLGLFPPAAMQVGLDVALFGSIPDENFGLF